MASSVTASGSSIISITSSGRPSVSFQCFTATRFLSCILRLILVAFSSARSSSASIDSWPDMASFLCASQLSGRVSSTTSSPSDCMTSSWFIWY